MTLIATIATGKRSAKEVTLLVRTLELFQKDAELFILTDSETQPLLPTSSLIHIRLRSSLDAYSGKSRSDMEALSGRKYSSLFTDFTMEKATVLDWIFAEQPEKAQQSGVWFLDADIALFAPLPVYQAPLTLSLSPHYIRAADERRFGHFNAGMIWLRDTKHLDIWRKATHSSRFFEQASLESVWSSCPEEERQEMPTQMNLGWWRHGQSAEAPSTIEKKLGFQRSSGCMGLKYDGGILQSIHTHWSESSAFNTWIKGALLKVQKSHEPAKKFLQVLLCM